MKHFLLTSSLVCSPAFSSPLWSYLWLLSVYFLLMVYLMISYLGVKIFAVVGTGHTVARHQRAHGVSEFGAA